MKKLSHKEAQIYLESLYARMSKERLRLGQAILNDHPELSPCPDIYYNKDIGAVLRWFHASCVGEGEVKLPLDLSLLKETEGDAADKISVEKGSRES